jgi:acyl-CoA-binding protein
MSTNEFEYAQDRIWDLPQTAGANEMLELYKLYVSSTPNLPVDTNKRSLAIAIPQDQEDLT